MDNIYLIERYHACDGDYGQVGFALTVEEADATVARLQRTVTECEQCGGVDTYSHRVMKRLDN
jgi:hypothetical protein